ncbi:MAG: phosphoadenosine phosphosulfate reductase family protein [Candidatus Nezhaarchaeales archaeon]
MKASALYWCLKCNVPLLTKNCDVCGGHSIKEVKVTPPGNIKPMFNNEKVRIENSIVKEYGKTVIPLIVPEDRIVLLNKVPHMDVAYEIIVDGHVVGLWEFDVGLQNFRLMPYMEGARRMAISRARKWILVDRGAEKAIAMDGKNLLAPGVVEYDESISENDIAYVVNEDWKAIAVGKVSYGFKQRLKERRGMVVKIKHFGEPKDAEILEKKATWSDAIAANNSFLGAKEKEAISLIQDICARSSKPILVSFSGGKDSLATLLLVKKALEESRKDFFVLFLDTGIEYLETITYVERILKQLGLEDKTIKVKAFARFFDVLDVFGPPARDFRWCCKVCKLAPISYAVRNLGGECLAFIGLRGVESIKREKQGAMWRGIWVKGQTGISPIYDWSTLNIWLYLFKEGVEVNPLYYKGLERIGCWVCPSMDLAEMRIVEELLGDSWKYYLEKVSKLLHLSEEEMNLGLWRWRFKRPGWLKDEENVILRRDPIQHIRRKRKILLKSERDFDKLINILKTLYDVHKEGRDVILTIGGRRVAILTKEDMKVLVKADEKEWIKIFRSASRALECVKCMLCLATCLRNAISISNDGIEILSERCIACGECNYTCPIWAYSLKSLHIAKRLLD